MRANPYRAFVRPMEDGWWEWQVREGPKPVWHGREQSRDEAAAKARDRAAAGFRMLLSQSAAGDWEDVSDG